MILALDAISTAAQGICPPVDRIIAPVDTDAFALVQDYGVRSPRHDGRYHTGEDWTLLEAPAAGQPVRAIANGTVTYAYTGGWGRDGGVVIVEHVLPDDSTAFSVYGHLMETETAPFPAGLACVSTGDVIGAVSDARPAPHLHFEIRTANGRAPGVGYTWDHPDTLDYLHPSRFVRNWQARLLRSVTFVADVPPPTAPPLVLDDNSLLLLDDRQQVVRVLPDGRQFWRRALPQPVVNVMGYQRQSYVHYADGTLQTINPDDGTLGESWRTDAAAAGAPFPLDDTLVFPAAGGGLVALGADRREVAWRADDVPPFAGAWVGVQVIGLMTPTHEFVTLRRDNAAMLDRAQMRAGASAAVAGNGSLIVYGRGGVWQVTAAGEWLPAPYIVPAPERFGAVAAGDDGALLFYDGANMRSVASNGVEQWAYPLPDVRGRVALAWLDGRALLVSTGGAVAVVNPLGNTCRFDVFGAPPDAPLWHALGDDGVLRVLVGGTLAGVDWRLFSRECVL